MGVDGGGGDCVGVGGCVVGVGDGDGVGVTVSAGVGVAIAFVIGVGVLTFIHRRNRVHGLKTGSTIFSTRAKCC